MWINCILFTALFLALIPNSIYFKMAIVGFSYGCTDSFGPLGACLINEYTTLGSKIRSRFTAIIYAFNNMSGILLVVVSGLVNNAD